MIKLLGDESVGADGKLILGGEGWKKKKERPAATFIVCISIMPKGSIIGWNIYCWKTKCSVATWRIHSVSHKPGAPLDPYLRLESKKLQVCRFGLLWEQTPVFVNERGEEGRSSFDSKHKADKLWQKERVGRTLGCRLVPALRPSWRRGVHSCWRPAWSWLGRGRYPGRRNHCGWRTRRWILCHRRCRSIERTQKAIKT